MRWIKLFFYNLALKERSPQKLALSFCLGNYIAFSPYLFLHTAMALVMPWMFNLNIAVTLASAYFINNLWTAAPIYMSDYLFGYWFVHTYLGYKAIYLPETLLSLQQYIGAKLGIESLCFWSFMIGGNILGVVTSLVLYPGAYHVSHLMLKELPNKEIV